MVASRCLLKKCARHTDAMSLEHVGIGQNLMVAILSRSALTTGDLILILVRSCFQLTNGFQKPKFDDVSRKTLADLLINPASMHEPVDMCALAWKTIERQGIVLHTRIMREAIEHSGGEITADSAQVMLDPRRAEYNGAVDQVGRRGPRRPACSPGRLHDIVCEGERA